MRDYTNENKKERCAVTAVVVVRYLLGSYCPLLWL